MMMTNDYSVDNLIRIAIALSAEKDTSKVLDMILQVAMKISNCDAGTVYVVEDDHLNFHNSYTYAKGFLNESTWILAVMASAGTITSTCPVMSCISMAYAPPCKFIFFFQILLSFSVPFD